ncbi:hypothetical protein KY343_04815 [Candidatus Woesearchaeota archaeon]|nr:hypothetical protein [Candidatus Woesearchaeota archaeon]
MSKKIFKIVTISGSVYPVEKDEHVIGNPEWSIERKGKKRKITAITKQANLQEAIDSSRKPWEFDKKLIPGNIIWYGELSHTSRIKSVKKVA